YMTEFTRYDIDAATGFTSEQLRGIAQAFITYFDAPPGRMDVQVARGPSLQPLFNERELVHMEDVQALMHLVSRVRIVALAYIGAFVLAGLVWRRSAFVPVLAWTVAAGAGLTVALFAALGALAATDFSELFIQFHLVSFSNDLWQLDPRRDYLIRLFPQGFFQDAALRVAALTIAQAVLLGAASLLALWLGRRQARLRTARTVRGPRRRGETAAPGHPRPADCGSWGSSQNQRTLHQGTVPGGRSTRGPSAFWLTGQAGAGAEGGTLAGSQRMLAPSSATAARLHQRRAVPAMHAPSPAYGRSPI